MSCSILVRKLFALAAVMLLLAAAPALAQNDIGFIEAPTPADLGVRSPSVRLLRCGYSLNSLYGRLC